MGAYAWVIDVTMVLMIMGITWVVASEGLWGASLMLVNVMFAGLVAFCLYEPCATWVATNLGFMASFADFTCLLVLFCIAFTIFRIATDNLGPALVRFEGWVEQVGRFLFGGVTAFYFVALLLCMVETAPVHKKFLGYQWRDHALWGMGIDRYWLGYVQESTDRIFEWERKRMFDANSDFIVRYHNFRPFGEPDESMPGVAKKNAPAAGGAQPGAGGQPAQTGGGQSGGRPLLDPTGATQQPGL